MHINSFYSTALIAVLFLCRGIQAREDLQVPLKEPNIFEQIEARQGPEIAAEFEIPKQYVNLWNKVVREEGLSEPQLVSVLFTIIEQLLSLPKTQPFAFYAQVIDALSTLVNQTMMSLDSDTLDANKKKAISYSMNSIKKFIHDNKLLKQNSENALSFRSKFMAEIFRALQLSDDAVETKGSVIKALAKNPELLIRLRLKVQNRE